MRKAELAMRCDFGAFYLHVTLYYNKINILACQIQIRGVVSCDKDFGADALRGEAIATFNV
jgi:hypothetical protein